MPWPSYVAFFIAALVFIGAIFGMGMAHGNYRAQRRARADEQRSKKLRADKERRDEEQRYNREWAQVCEDSRLAKQYAAGAMNKADSIIAGIQAIRKKLSQLGLDEKPEEAKPKEDA